MGLLDRLLGRSAKSVEGAPRDGPWILSRSGGALPADVGRHLNWWQMGFDPVAGLGTSAMVEACISAYAQTVAMCPGDHWRRDEDGGRTRVANSALSRVLRQPNAYQSISDFLLNAVWSLYGDGNAYALALRNDRFEIAELHLMSARDCGPRLAQDGSVFYRLAGNPLIDRLLPGPLLVPARDVLHVRLHTPKHPLIGESPIRAAALDVATGDAMMRQQLAFFLNQSRPSYVLGTDLKLDRDQAQQLRDAWNEQSQGLAQGGVPILSGGLKPYPLSVSAENAQLAEIMKMPDQRVALVYRIPMQIFGLGAGGAGSAPAASTEALMQSWIATGLGFALNHVEEAFGRTFGLRGGGDEYLELDTDALLRSSMKDRIEALARGVQGGIYAPNEARTREGLRRVAHGDEPRVQQQVVPLSAAEAIPAAPASPGPSEPAPHGDDPEPNDDDTQRVLRAFRASHGQHVAA